MIKVLSGDNDIDGVEEWLSERKIGEEDEVTVSELLARCLVTAVENVMQFFKVTLEKACEGLGVTVSRYVEAKESFALPD